MFFLCAHRNLPGVRGRVFKKEFLNTKVWLVRRAGARQIWKFACALVRKKRQAPRERRPFAASPLPPFFTRDENLIRRSGLEERLQNSPSTLDRGVNESVVRGAWILSESFWWWRITTTMW